MAESQAEQASTQQQGQSQQVQVDSRHSEVSRPQQERQAQERQRSELASKSPFSSEAMKAKLMQALRKDRGVPEPKEPSRANEQVGDAPSSSDAGSGAAEPHRESGDSAAHHPTVAAPAQAKDAPSEAAAQWMQREQQAQALEQRAREATTQAEQRAADAEAKEARAAEKLQKMEWAMQSPVEYMQEVGMTQEQWSDFLANGGKLTPEQKRTREMEKKVQQMAEQMEAMRRETETQRQQDARRLEEATFGSQMNAYTFVPQMGGVQSVRNHQRLLEAQLKQPVSLKDAADSLERDLQGRMHELLKHETIRSKLGLADNVNQSQAARVEQSPRTLNAQVSSETTSRGADRPAPNDWAGKMALYRQRIEQERRARTSD